MVPFGRLAGAHRLKPEQDGSAVLDRIAAALAADPNCTLVSRGPEGVAFELGTARWCTWRVGIGLFPRAGRIVRGTFAHQPDRPRDLVSYDLRLDVRRPLLISAFWAAIAITVAAFGVISATVAAILVGLAVLRFVVRQGETEWAHDLIGKAATDPAMPDGAAPPGSRIPAPTAA
jgi:hypothetical protein